MRHKAQKVVSKAMRTMADEGSIELKKCPSGMFILVRGFELLVRKLKQLHIGEGVVESCVSVTREEVAWRGYMERIINESNDWDHRMWRKCSGMSSRLCMLR